MRTSEKETPLGCSRSEFQAADVAMTRPRCRRWIRFLVSIIIVSVLAGGSVCLLLLGQSRADLPTCKVGLEILQETYQTRGDLEASEATDVVCRVKARTAGSNFSTTILWVIEDGSPVRRGQVLIQLDDSALQEELRTQQTALDLER
jgi:multidrug efflux pump subunit AcrA (membrane-fusion protein)